MISTAVITAICIVLLLLEILCNYDFTAPAFLVTASFSLCLLCTSMIGDLFPEHYWDISEIHIETGALIIVFLIIFILVDRACFTISKRNLKNVVNKELMSLRLSNSILCFGLILGFVSIAWGILNFRNYWAGDWISTMAIYKLSVNSGAIKESLSSKMLNQLVKVLEAFVHVVVFCYLNNIASKVENTKKSKLCFAVILIYMIGRMIISGGRQRLIFVVVAAITGMLITKTYAEENFVVKKEKIKYLKLMAIIIVMLLPLFYFMGRLVGRHESEVLYAMIAYLSTGIFGLEQIVADELNPSYWGQYSFPGLMELFKYIGIAQESAESTAVLDYQVFAHGNTVTMIGRWYWDFGWIGTIVMGISVAFLFSHIYYRNIVFSMPSHKRNICIIIYLFLSHILYFAGYDDFIQTLLGTYYVQIVILIYIIYRFAIKNKKRSRGNRT